MIDLDKALVAALLRDGAPALKDARAKGLRPDLLMGEGQKIYEFVIDYFVRYGDLPAMDVVQGKTGLTLDELAPNVHAGFVVDAVLDRNLHAKLRLGWNKMDELLKAQPTDAQKALGYLEEFLLELRREKLSQSKVESLFLLGPEVRAYYEAVKGGKQGIQTPWPAVNAPTLGFWPMDLILFVARVGIGKTWTAVILALNAWRQGKRVLFASTEISRTRIAMRLFALMYRLPYKEFVSGKLGMHIEKTFFDGMEEMLNKEGLYVVGGDFDFRVESFSAALDEIKPDLAILDGAYLLRTSGATRTEKAANAFDDLKRLAHRHKIAMAVTHQFNREVKASVASTARVESIGLTDVAGWNADLIFGLIQTDEMKKDKKMRIKPLKVREGVGDEVEVRWDFDTMDFSQLGIVTSGGSASGGDAAEFDTGLPPGTGSNSGGSDDVPF